MRQDRNSTLGWIFVSRVIGILCFLIVMVLANILTYYVTNPLYHSAVNFVNGEFWLLLLIAVIMMVADLFTTFTFPLNLPAPIIRAIGSVFVIAFILRLFSWVDTIAGTNLYEIFWLVSFLVIPLVFLIILVTGYYEIMRRLSRQQRPAAEPGTDATPAETPEGAVPPVSDTKSWDEIGTEFRLMLYDIIHRFREDIKKGR